jgi:indole-3-glycerol phosphate synthase
MNYRFPEGLRGTVLERIVASKIRVIRAAKKKWAAESIRMVLDRAPRIRSLKRTLSARPLSIIAELKRASPSAGVLRHDFKPLELADELSRAGAAAISVLTENEHFKGELENLAQLRWHVDLPLLRKDFIVDPYQLFEARHAGADAVLLIAALLDDRGLRQLRQQTEALGMDALVEVHDRRELDGALDAGAGLIGVNNRDLRSFETSLDIALELAPHLPKEVVPVAESGIRTGEDIRLLSEAGYRGFLVGETLMRSASPGAALSKLLAFTSRRQ